MTEVAKTILSQLGGNMFVRMTGAKGFVSAPRTLVFQIGRNKSKANRVRIRLDGNDTYTIEFSQYRNFEQKDIEVRDNVYCDQLAKVFTAVTGLYTRL